MKCRKENKDASVKFQKTIRPSGRIWRKASNYQSAKERWEKSETIDDVAKRGNNV